MLPHMATEPILTLSKCLIRPYMPSDAPDIKVAADSSKLARYMRNTFPNPYTLGDAEAWIGTANGKTPRMDFAICTPMPASVVIGGIGLKTLADVESRTLEIGYWVGEKYWGGGITSEAVVAFTRWVFANFGDVHRLEASVYEGNEASMRVLAKAGYQSEGRRRKAAWKNGENFDICHYGILRDECESG